MDAKLDHILGQLTTINIRLNSHDTRLPHVETGTPARVALGTTTLVAGMTTTAAMTMMTTTLIKIVPR
jgi:hypothetical protein